MKIKQNSALNLEKSPGFPVISKIIDVLRDENISGYLVGGFVRDIILGLNSVDIDIALSHLNPDILEKISGSLHGKYFILDPVNKVARMVVQDAGNTWHIDIAPLRDSIRDDLAKRDFSINAMAIPLENPQGALESLTLIDPHCGMKDIHNRYIRAINHDIFQNDPARLLRAIRIAAELGFRLEAKTAKLVKLNSPLLKQVPGERIRLELVAILEARDTGSRFYEMDEMDLLGVLFPEFMGTRGVEQPKEHFWDVFNHSIETVRAVENLLSGSRARGSDSLLSSVPWSPEISEYFNKKNNGEVSRGALLKLAALLHDVAKPATRALDGERLRFLGHAQKGAEIIELIMHRLRFSKRETDIVSRIVYHHLRPGQLTNEDLPSPRAIYRYFRDLEDIAVDVLYFSLADHLATRGPNIDPENWKKHTGMISYIVQAKEANDKSVSPPKLVDGHEIMKRFHLEPGPRIGVILEQIKEAQASGEINTKDEALNLVKRQYAHS